MSLSLTLPWTRVCRISPSPRRNDNATLTMSSSSIINNKCNSNENVDRDDSAFIEPEYSNTSGSNPASYHSYTNRSSGSNERISCEDEEGTHHAKPYRQEDYEEDDDGDYSSPCPDYDIFLFHRRIMRNWQYELEATVTFVTKTITAIYTCSFL